ncbi:MAG TPA: glutamate racemase [Candidatus Hydrogenedentes bacterium]|nr:glutamate racemase [Candidatus Hydrogenedentota bacterium]HPG69949.1 glutamate racemase [Candidatus Hydrogenedentota bacterium]
MSRCTSGQVKHADVSDGGASIGVFDSGVGGLTVVRRIMERLPAEEIVYLGDTARVPYGTKSPHTVIRYARACAAALLERGIKLLVVACNTASSHALDALRAELDVPVIGVVEPGARRAAAATRNGRIGVIGTAGTVASGTYADVIHAVAPEVKVFSKACPLFVPLAEEGWIDGPVPRETARTYLAGLGKCDIDTLVLGCTHYPLLAGVIADAMGQAVSLVDSAAATAEVVEQTLAGLGRLRDGASRTHHRYLVSDDPGSFVRVGARFLGCAIDDVEWVDF